jgi:hypothetical protein
MNPAASHQNYHVAEQTLQLYLDAIFNWTKNNVLMRNPDKFTATLFTTHTHKHNVTLNLKINNILIPTVKSSKIVGLTLDPCFNFSEHIKITKEKAESSIKIIKALTSTSWGKQKETLLATYKTFTLPVIEYARTLWYATASETNMQSLQTVQNSTLGVIFAASQTPTHNIFTSRLKHYLSNTTSNFMPHSSDKNLI